jgi:uncharacterized membrane protein
VLYLIERLPKSVRVPRLIVVTVVALLSVSACGGGGGDGANSAPSGTLPPTTGGAQADTTSPSPPTSVSGAAVATEITVSWSGATDNVGVARYKVYRNGTLVATLASASMSHIDVGLAASTRYCYDITASDAAGNESAHSSQACATTALADTASPTITSTRPANDATASAVDAVITVIFSEAMDPATLNQATFKLADASDNPIIGAISYSGTTATFSPTDLLAAAATYTAIIAAEVKDSAGNPLATAYSWTFKTGLATYELTAVGEDPPSEDEELFTLVADLNEKGEIVGEAIRSWNLNTAIPNQESIAFLWRNGRLIDLGALSQSPRDSRSQGINDQSEVVGWSYPGVGAQPAFQWREDRMTPIGLEDAYAINNAGQVVGYINRAQGSETVGVPAVWQSGQLTELLGLGNPWNINDSGDIVGFSYVAQFPQAALWRAGVVTPLGLLPDALSSQAFDINSEGLIVGTNEFSPPVTPTAYQRAFLWQSGTMIELPRVAASHSSNDAYGINDHGNVVGRSGASQFTATVWFDGAAYDLNELIAADDPLKPYITLLEAREINNRGQIIAQGADSRRSGSYSGYLLTPKRARHVDEHDLASAESE